MPPSHHESQLQRLGRELLNAADQQQRRFGIGERWLQRLMHYFMEDERFRVRALRFIDTLPTLESPGDLARHLGHYFAETQVPLPGWLRWSIGHADEPGMRGVSARLVRLAMDLLSERFMAGEDAMGVAKQMRRMRALGCNVSLDLLGELTVSEAESEAYCQTYLDLLPELVSRAADLPADELLDHCHKRPVPRLNFSLKLSALYSQIRAADHGGSVAAISERLRPLLRALRAAGAGLFIDMEQYDYRPIVTEVFQQVMMEPEFRDWSDVGIAMQAYLREAESDLAAMLAWAERRGTPVWIRLVRGAYWDQEQALAEEFGWPSPVWPTKAHTDACYERCLEQLFAAWPRVYPAVATHNVRSLALAQVLAKERGIQADQYEIQMLHGMAEALRAALVAQGLRVRVYLPFGEILPGMAYLVRRLLENSTSQVGVALGMAGRVSDVQLLTAPKPDAQALVETAPDDFHNEPLRRFVESAEREAFAQALDGCEHALGQDYPLWIKGQAEQGEGWVASYNPAAPGQLVGRLAQASETQIEQAVAAAQQVETQWAAWPLSQRADRLRALAAQLRQRRDEFSAWQVFEAGKSWSEADADVCEAIDFLEYYARSALTLAQGLQVDSGAETNLTRYLPRGLTLVLPPWNFPLAITLGMCSAALVMGNPVILKPSSETPIMAARLMELMQSLDLPPGVMQLLGGPGGSVGRRLAEHPAVKMIAFTGSLEVGSGLYRRCAELGPEQGFFKHLVAEMGGKNAIIVDSDADIDAAVMGIIQSAYGFQGQKCSAASRVIAVGGAYTQLQRRLPEAVASLIQGPAQDPHHTMGPVISQAAQRRIQRMIDTAEEQGARKLYQSDTTKLGEGHWVGPTLFAEVDPQSPLAQEEVFGPVVALMPADDFEQALSIANGTHFGLTGGVFSRYPPHLTQAREQFAVGNLYFNRKISGALVGRQPFGGLKLSGLGAKTGGPDYLRQFVQTRTVTSNTLRRGYAPQSEIAGEFLDL